MSEVARKIQLDKYSTSEQVVGTWIDGKPLYRCTYSTTTPSDSTDTIVVALPSTYLVKNIYGTFHQSPNNYMPLNYLYNTTYFSTYYQYSPSSGIRMRTNSTTLQGKSCEVTIEYTKTTD